MIALILPTKDHANIIIHADVGHMAAVRAVNDLRFSVRFFSASNGISIGVSY